jgi:DNA-binding beta-propeller fold protein YncE
MLTPQLRRFALLVVLLVACFTSLTYTSAATPGEETASYYDFSFPNGLAIDNAGRLYVANFGANNILVLSPSGTVLNTYTTELSQPQDVAVDSAGNSYVASRGNNRIVIFRTNSKNSVSHQLGWYCVR